MTKYQFEKHIAPESMQQLRLALWRLVRNEGTAFSIFIQKMDLRAISGDCMFVCHPQADGNFVLGINFEQFDKLDTKGKEELFKHIALHIPYGHKSGRARQLIGQYGADITELAQDIVVNQYVNMDILAVNGVNLPTPEAFGLPRNKTTDWYAAQLYEQATSGSSGQQVGEGGFGLPRPQFGPPGNNPNGFPTDGNGFTKMDPADSSDPGETTDRDLDEASGKMVKSADETMKSMGKETGLKSQGWFPGECEEFIESLQRQAKISWSTMIKRKIGKHKSVRRTPTRRRPSRRFPVFWGRKKSTGVSFLLVVDTSGSMGAKELRCVSAEAKGMVRCGTDVWVAYVDAGVAKEPFRLTQHVKLETFLGRGGTDFRPAFEMYREMPDPPEFMVYLTDGMGTAPPEHEVEDIDVLWLLTSSGMKPDEFKKHIPYGDVAVLDVDD